MLLRRVGTVCVSELRRQEAEYNNIEEKERFCSQVTSLAFSLKNSCCLPHSEGGVVAGVRGC